MSEFVCEVAPDEFGELTEVARLGEEIVRCRDCKYMAGENNMGVSPNYCSKLSYYVKPNNYCAWGEKR